VTRAENPRSASPLEIREASHRVAAEFHDAESVPEALTKAQGLAGADGIIVVTGSIYVVGEAMRQLAVRI